jgi:hypothetical protein
MDIFLYGIVPLVISMLTAIFSVEVTSTGRWSGFGG